MYYHAIYNATRKQQRNYGEMSSYNLI